MDEPESPFVSMAQARCAPGCRAAHAYMARQRDTLHAVMADAQLKLQMRDGLRPGEKVVVLEGVLNADTAFHFRDLVRQGEPTTLVVDMSKVRYVDSSGLGVLIGAYVSFDRSCRRLLLAGLNDRVWELFRMCKVDDVFTRYPTVADAQRF
ncbi:MAG: anti-sigma factor antagonist [Terriglobia bacterium]|nr:MAG: anti-sigma factor antagonist [Terriglobia bacterium]